MKDVMIDLETLGHRKNAPIIQIGACYFDRITGVLGAEFKLNVDLPSAVAAGGEIDPETVLWWMQQSDEARKSIMAPPNVDIKDAMTQLNEFLKDAKCIWSHATFDYVIIMETYKRLNINPLFSFRTARDIRTLVDLAKTTVDKTARSGTHHDALEDAKHQVKYCVIAFNNLNKIKQFSEALKKLSPEDA